jgi:hypothetical protein
MSRRIVGSGLGGLHSNGAGLELDGIERIELKNDHMPAMRQRNIVWHRRCGRGQLLAVTKSYRGELEGAAIKERHVR